MRLVACLLCLLPVSASADGILGQRGSVALNFESNLPPNVQGTTLDNDGNVYRPNGPTIECSGPGSGGSVQYLFNGSTRRLFAAVDRQGGGLLVAAFESGQNGPPQLSLHRVRCGTPVEDLGILSITQNTYPALGTDIYGFFDLYTAIDPQGRLCLPTSDGFGCFAPGTPLQTERVLSIDPLRNLVKPVNQTWHDLLPEVPATARETSARVGPFVFSADGTLFAVLQFELSLESSPNVFEVHAARWLVQIPKTGAPLVRHGPDVIQTTGVGTTNLEIRKTLAGINSLAIDTASGTLMGYPRPGRRLEYAAWANHGVYDGIGVATWPLVKDPNHEDAPGHIELSQVFQATLGNPRYVEMKQGAGGQVVFVGSVSTFTLDFDPEDIDMDEDGLSASEERGLGTSDYLKDSDGGGSRDNLETGVYGTNPTSSGDDRAWTRQHTTDIDYPYSVLIREKLDVEVDPQVFGSDYLCGRGTCWDRDGKKAVDGVGTYGPFVTEDGRHGVVQVGGEIRRYDLKTGQFEKVTDVSNITSLIPSAGGGVTLTPGKGNRVFIVGENRVIAFGDAPPRVVFDLTAEQCASKLGTCGPSPIDTTAYLQDVYTNLLLVGFDPVIDRLLVLAKGNMASALLGVAPGVEPVVLAGANDMPEIFLGTSQGAMPSAVLPDAMVPTASGELWASYEGAAGYVDGDYRAYDGPNTDFLGGIPSRGWDDSLFVNSAGGPTPRGLFEMVRMEGRIEPGDLLMFAGPSSLNPTTFLPGAEHGPYLFRIGRRGAALPFWDKVGAPGTFKDLVSIRGMGVSKDGRICAAGFDGRLHELTNPDPTTHVPLEIKTYTFLSGVADCLYDAQGNIHALIESPPGIAVFDSRTEDPASLYAIDGVGMPTRFVQGPDGSYVVADATGPIFCADVKTEALTAGSILAAGLTIGRDGQLLVLQRPEGSLLRVPFAVACAPGATVESLGVDAAKLYAVTSRPVFPWIVASIAERPDGRIVIMPSRSRLTPYDPSLPINESMYLFFFDPADKSFLVDHGEYGFGAEGSALATVPGGTWNDPWGERTGVDGGTSNPGRDGGVGDGAVGTEKEDEGGCGCGTTSRVGSPWGVLGALALVRRRRRARRAVEEAAFRRS